MHLRTIFPVLFSIAGIFTILVPILGGTEVDDSATIATGDNSYSYELNGQKVFADTPLRAEVVHKNNLFHLTLWLGAERQDRLTFVLKDTEVAEGVYDLDAPEKRYMSFELHTLNCTYTPDEYLSGLLMIHAYDRELQLIAGSFEFLAFSDDCNELVRVRNGIFDAAYTSNQLN
jgi:hypothetical protein